MGCRRKAGWVLAMVLVLSAISFAQERDEHREYNDDRGRTIERENNDPAYQHGFKDGFDLGANAARTHATYNDHNSGAYNHADNGFPGGDKGAYQQRYRQAYTEGYRAGYEEVREQSSGNYGRYSGSNDPAYQHGYKDGFDLGANAARTRATYNDHNSGAYNHADDGFPGGDKGAYQQRYRQAYTEGYRAGYEQVRRQLRGNHAQYPGSNDPAYQHGYKDGFDLGANAARTGAVYNDHDSGAYNHADNGFPGGDKGAYQQRYRQAYTEGYRAGYEQTRSGYVDRR